MSAMKRRRISEGQALTEFLVLAVALVPLLLLFPLLAKYQDISHATQVASRYVAFEATIRNDRVNSWKFEQQLAQEVRTRFFGRTNDPIIAVSSAPDPGKASANLFWRTPEGTPLIADLGEQVKVSFGAQRGAGHAAAFQRASDGRPFSLRGQLGLQDSGVYGANVEVALARLPSSLKAYAPFDQIGLNLSRTTAVLIDPWMSRSPDETDQRVGHHPGIFPSAGLRPLGAALDPVVSSIDGLGQVRGPRLGELEFWQDIVPSDRLR